MTERARGQSPAWSLIEASVSVAIGYVVAILANVIVLPLFGMPVRLDQAAGIAFAFTFISLVRSYLVRRLFNRMGN